MSLNSNIVYSVSLRRMIGFKLFPDINPDTIQITQKNQEKNPQKLQAFPLVSKNNDKINKMKKQIVEAKKKQYILEKQIDNIVGKMVDQGLVDVDGTGASRSRAVGGKRAGSRSKRHLRILTEGSQLDKNGKEKSKSIVQLPQVEKSISATKITKNRLATQLYQRNQQQIYEPVNANKYIKHYRQGMTSLKRLKIRPTH